MSGYGFPHAVNEHKWYCEMTAREQHKFLPIYYMNPYQQLDTEED